MEPQEAFDLYAKPHLLGQPTIRLHDDDRRRVAHAALEIAEKRANSHGTYVTDSEKLFSRFYHGMLGELVLERHLGVTGILDLTSDKISYDHPDLQAIGVNCGVKTSLVPLLPIYKRSKPENQVLVFLSKGLEAGKVAGYASAEVMAQHVDDSLVMMDSAREHKTCFVGIKHCQTFKTLCELRCLVAGGFCF